MNSCRKVGSLDNHWREIEERVLFDQRYCRVMQILVKDDLTRILIAVAPAWSEYTIL